MAKEAARAWVFRTEYSIELSKLNVQLLDKQKLIHGQKSDKKKVDLHYTEKTTEFEAYMGAKVIKSVEESTPVKFWITPSRQAELQTIGSTLLSLLEEIPDLVEFRDMLRAVRASIEVLGWPSVLGIKLGLANSLSITGSISPLRPIIESQLLSSVPE